MNAPGRFESFLLLPGEKKIVVEKDNKVPNAAIFFLAKEDHTVGCVLSSKIFDINQVISFLGLEISKI